MPGGYEAGTLRTGACRVSAPLRVPFNGSLQGVKARIAVRYLQALNERALHKEMVSLLKVPGVFGVLGATQTIGGAALAAARLEELRKTLEGKSLHPKKGKIAWEGKDEETFIVPKIQPRDLFQLGQRFNQTYVALKSADGVVSLYAGKGQPRVWVALPAKLWGADELPRGFAQEGSVVFGSSIPWDWHSVFDLRKLKSM